MDFNHIWVRLRMLFWYLIPLGFLVSLFWSKFVIYKDEILGIKYWFRVSFDGTWHEAVDKPFNIVSSGANSELGSFSPVITVLLYLGIFLTAFSGISTAQGPETVRGFAKARIKNFPRFWRVMGGMLSAGGTTGLVGSVLFMSFARSLGYDPVPYSVIFYFTFIIFCSAVIFGIATVIFPGRPIIPPEEDASDESTPTAAVAAPPEET